jgi:hypothetical protein
MKKREIQKAAKKTPGERTFINGQSCGLADAEGDEGLVRGAAGRDESHILRIKRH